mgnify:CR=1 FL=1
MTGGREKKQQRRVRNRRISVRAVRRDPVDVRKLSRALIALAEADAERAAQADHQQRPEQPSAEREGEC